MHPALWQLIWFDFNGSMKSLLNVRKNWRQLLLMLVLLGFVAFFVIFRMYAEMEAAGGGRFGPAMPFWAFLYLSATWLTASADRGLVMRPAEIHFVAGGPFRDRDVITLNLIRLAFRSFISATVLSLLALSYVESYPSALVGIWMLIGVSLLIGMLVSIMSRDAQPRLIKQVRRVLTAGWAVSLVLLITQSLQLVREAGESPKVSTVASKAIETPIGSYLLPPLQWLFAPLTSEAFFPATIALLPVRLGIVAAIIAAIYLFSSRYVEASTGRTDLSVSRRKSALRSGVAGTSGSGGWLRRVASPPLPSWGGLGSIAWMQMTHSIRILPRFIVFTLTIVGVVLVIPVMVDRSRLEGWNAVGWMVALNCYADFLLLLQLPVGFLGPTTQREMLKSLPIPSWRVAIGQLAGPVIPLAVMHIAIWILFIFLVPQQTQRVSMVALALVPAAIVLISNVNLLGIWKIIRPRALQQRDALAAGRAMASVWIFFAMLTPTIIVATTCSVLVGNLLIQGGLGYTIGASVGTLLSCPFYLFLLARSFERWQPSAVEGGQEEKEHNQ